MITRITRITRLQELIASIIEIVDDEDYSGLNEEIKKHEELLKGGNIKS